MVEITKDQWELLRRPATVATFKELPDVVQLVILAAYDDLRQDRGQEEDLWCPWGCYDCLERAVCKVYDESQQTMRAFVRAWLWLNENKLEGWFIGGNKRFMREGSDD